MPLTFAQSDPPPTSAPGPIDVHIDLSGLANLIWQSFIDHIGDVGNAVWTGIRDHMGEIGMAIWTPLVNTLHDSARAVWDGVWHSSINIVTLMPADLTYNLPACCSTTRAGMPWNRAHPRPGAPWRSSRALGCGWPMSGVGRCQCGWPSPWWYAVPQLWNAIVARSGCASG